MLEEEMYWSFRSHWRVFCMLGSAITLCCCFTTQVNWLIHIMNAPHPSSLLLLPMHTCHIKRLQTVPFHDCGGGKQGHTQIQHEKEKG